MKQYNLIDLQTFVSVVEAGSFNQAAIRLDTSAASVSRRVSALEDALGTRLLNRTTRQLSLTESGQQYFDDVQNVLIELQAAEERICVGEAEVRGNIRVAAPMSFGVQSIAAVLPDFLAQHPGINIELQLEDKQTDLNASGIDLALRIGRLEDSSLIATRICDINFGFFASPAYMKQRGEPANPADLQQHECLHYTLVNRSDEWPLPANSVSRSSALSANNGEVLREAAIRGTGIVALPYFIVEAAIADGQLTAVLESFAPRTMGLYAIRISRRFTPARVRLLIDYLKERLQIR